MEDETVVNSAKVESIDNVTVSSSVLADLFSLTDRRIRQLNDEGIIVRVKKGRYDLTKSIKNYILHLKTNNDLKDNNDESSIDLDQERALHERVKRQQSELKLAAMKGTMHSTEDVERVMTDMLVSFRTKLCGMPSKIAPILIARDDISLIESLISKEVSEALNELKDYNPQDFYSDKFIDYDDDPELRGVDDIIVEPEKEDQL